MHDKQSLSHTMRECKYHLVRVPKCRRSTCGNNYTAS